MDESKLERNKIKILDHDVLLLLYIFRFNLQFGMPPGYPGLSPLIPPTGGLSSTLTGAFQPKVHTCFNYILFTSLVFRYNLKDNCSLFFFNYATLPLLW